MAAAPDVVRRLGAPLDADAQLLAHEGLKQRDGRLLPGDGPCEAASKSVGRLSEAAGEAELIGQGLHVAGAEGARREGPW